MITKRLHPDSRSHRPLNACGIIWIESFGCDRNGLGQFICETTIFTLIEEGLIFSRTAKLSMLQAMRTRHASFVWADYDKKSVARIRSAFGASMHQFHGADSVLVDRCSIW
jgi:hypothetical protein